MPSDFDEDFFPPSNYTPESPEPAAPQHPLPFPLDGVDLLSPPGFVGRVARWIEAQSRRPRRNLAVAAALTATGNIGGLHFTDDLDGVTCNLFTFCVAGSRTGKEAIQQAVTEIHRVAGIAAATHGSIKSEQEIVRNLTRHQASLYVIDEIGILLQKIKNAQKKGGAAYLDGVIGILMSAYSKADGYMLLTGDAKEDVRKALTGEISGLKKRIDEGDHVHGAEKRLADLERTLNGLDNGLERPFLSMIGFTTPVTFDDLVDYQSATNGFIGRSLLFNERDTAPRSKPGFRKMKMPMTLEAAISQIGGSGEYDSQVKAGRVESYADLQKIRTDQDASEMLAKSLDWFEDFAEAQKGQSGLEALSLGAYEIVSKVSLILSLSDGIRTAEHVRWAFALVRRDVDEKMRLVTANDRKDDDPALALAARIANVIDGDGETVGVIYNRLRGIPRPKVDEALAKMVERGLVEADPVVNRFNKAKSVKYRLVSG